MLLFQQMLVLFFLMMIGYFLRKRDIFSEDTCRAVSWLVVHVANPALILSGSISRSKPLEPGEIGLCLGVSVLIFAGMILTAAAVTPVFRIPKKSRGTCRVMLVFSNVGFMGFPVVSAVYGADALLYASVFLIPYNLLLYTYGIEEMRGLGTERRSISWKKILNIGVVTSVLSLLIAVFDLQMPDFVRTAVSSLSGLTAPLSMMVIGASMVNLRIRELFADGRLLVFALLKLILLPTAGMLLLGLFLKNEMLLGVCLVMLATPVGSMTAMLAQQYGGDYELDSRGVALTTLLSVLTIPLVSMLVG